MTTPERGARLILLRHGETEHNVAMRLTGWGDPPLNETGVAQAENAAARIVARYGKEGISAIYASPLRRALETAQPIAHATGHTPIYYPDLRELYFGLVEGFTPEEIIAQHPHLLERARVHDDLEFAWPEGESRGAFYSRITRAIRDIVCNESRSLAEIVDDTPDRVAVVATHGGVVGAVLAEIADGLPHRWREFLPQNATFTDLVIYDDGATPGKGSAPLTGRIISAGPFVPMPEESTDQRGLLDRPPTRRD